MSLTSFPPPFLFSQIYEFHDDLHYLRFTNGIGVYMNRISGCENYILNMEFRFLVYYCRSLFFITLLSSPSLSCVPTFSTLFQLPPRLFLSFLSPHFLPYLLPSSFFIGIQDLWSIWVCFPKLLPTCTVLSSLLYISVNY